MGKWSFFSCGSLSIHHNDGMPLLPITVSAFGKNAPKHAAARSRGKTSGTEDNDGNEKKNENDLWVK